MKPQIQVLGSGCITCRKLYELTKEVVAEMGIKTEVEYITDIQKIVAMGLMSSPVLAVNGEPVFVGMPSGKEKIKELIKKGSLENTEENEGEESSKYSCEDGKC